MNELYVGLMSGTSMDAIDAVLVDFSQGVRLLGTHSVTLPHDLRQRITRLCTSGPDEIEHMGRLDVELGELFATAALGVLASSESQAEDVRAIGSHGQTIRHRPGAHPPFTLQIGNPCVIAERCGIDVVADFRRRDLAAGGQGAPLVPAFHAGIFGGATCHRIILNLGGIANITVLPEGVPTDVRGHDTGPANILMDAWCQQSRGMTYDAGGEWAAEGDVHPELLARLLAHPYFSRPAPKSTGREEFNLEWLNEELSHLVRPPTDVDVQATLLELTARSVALGVQATLLNGGEVLVCGGGAFNTRLWHRLSELLPTWALRSTAEFGLAPTWVEAVAFAWLARQTILGHPGNLPSVTGAAGTRILGAIYRA
ncbi:MAG TPA: anhydro-N-acetylmuramic acid kinase [Moraxellaceae bacterium]|nr:anhydro-N-acetylmuramic acid kinase [Moraxellaceae bacterium]